MKVGDAYFSQVDGVGPLYLRHVFVEFEGEPILFLCCDTDENVYLCLCSEMRSEQRWLISKSNEMILKKMTSGEIDIRTALEQSADIIIHVCTANGNESSQIAPISTVDTLDLPEPNTFLIDSSIVSK